MKAFGKLIAVIVILMAALYPRSIYAAVESAVFEMHYPGDTRDYAEDAAVVWPCGITQTECISPGSRGQNFGYILTEYGDSFYYCYFRWAMTIPKDATVLSAYVRVKSYDFRTGSQTAVFKALEGDGLWNAYIYGFSPYYYIYPDRLLDTSRQGTPVEWEIGGNWNVGSYYDGPDIANLVQARLDDWDYTPDALLGFFGLVLEHVSGDTHRTIYGTSRDTNQEGAAHLHITWTSSGEDKIEAELKEIEDRKKTGDPVDVTSGNMTTFPQVDFTLSGINEPLRFYRTYHSQSDYNGPLGYGWTHAYNIMLTTTGSDPTALEILDGDGKSRFFADYDGDDTFDSTIADGSYVVETSGTPNTYVWETKDGKKYHFDDNPETVSGDSIYRVSSIEYPDGNIIDFEYNISYQLTHIVDTHGRTVTLSYTDGRIASIVEPGRQPYNEPILYEYDGTYGNLTKVTYPIDTNNANDYVREYAYNDPSEPGNDDPDPYNLIEIIDERGNSFYFDYDGDDRCILSQGENLGSNPYFKTEMEYHMEENYTIVRRIRGGETFTDTYTYDGRGFITQIDHAESGVTKKYVNNIIPGDVSILEELTMKESESYYLKKISTYDVNFNLTDTVEGIVDSEGDTPPDTNKTYVEYNNQNYPNLPTDIIDQRGTAIKLIYDENPEDPGDNGKVTTTYKYNDVLDPGTQYENTTFEYNTDGTLYRTRQWIDIANNKESVTTFSYDPINGILTSIDPPGQLKPVLYEHDGAGRVTKITRKSDTGGDRDTIIDRDWLGRITQITYPEAEQGAGNLIVTYDYDVDQIDLLDPAASYGVNVVDTNGIKTQYLYNSAGLLWKVVRDRDDDTVPIPIIPITTFSYDAYGNLTALTDPKSQTTSFAYDSLDRLVAISEHGQSYYKQFAYYPDGSLNARTDQNGATTVYGYDENNRLSLITYPDSTVEYGYASNGLLAAATNSVGTVTFDYDPINRLEWTDGSLVGDIDKVSYDFFDNGVRQFMTSRYFGTPTTITYDITAWNAVYKISDPQGHDTWYTYNTNTGNISQINYPNDTYTDYDYDNLDRLDSYTASIIGTGSFTYDYDYHDSNLISKITLPEGNFYEYVYDDLYRLTTEILDPGDGGPSDTQSYQYDDAGNRTGLSGVVDEYYTMYNNGLNQLEFVGRSGEPPYTSFQYDNNGNMTLQYFAPDPPNPEQYVYFEYDYENRLTRILYPDGGLTKFVYDALGRRLRTIEKDRWLTVTSKRQYIYDGLDLIAELDKDGVLVASYTHGPGIDDPINVRLGGETGDDFFYHKNHQGSITEITDINGNIAKMYKYDAFGRKYFESGPPLVDEFAYTARQRHDRTGLYYYRNRFYNPQLGRFLSQDPIGITGGANLYAYVGNDPVNFIDPLGLIGTCEVVSVVAPPALNITLALINPYATLAVSTLEYAGALYLFNEEIKYQQTRAQLIDMVANADYLTPEQKVNYLEDVPLMSGAGYGTAQFTFSATVGLYFGWAK